MCTKVNIQKKKKKSVLIANIWFTRHAEPPASPSPDAHHPPSLLLCELPPADCRLPPPCCVWSLGILQQSLAPLRFFSRRVDHFRLSQSWRNWELHSVVKSPSIQNLVMASTEKQVTVMEQFQGNDVPRKPRILLAASGSVAAMKFANLCHCFCEWAEVKAVATKASLHFIDKTALPKDLMLYTDEEEWSSWKKIGDSVLHIELRRWADIMVIAPLSANTLGKIAGGLCDNLLTCIVRAWDYSKPLFVAPAMNTLMWNNPFTERHLMLIDDLGINLIPPVTKRLACGDYGNGAMAEPSLIFSTVRLFLESRPQ